MKTKQSIKPGILIIFLLSHFLALGQELLQVYTVNYPLAYFCARLGNPWVEVHFPIDKGVDPAHWRPDQQTVARYQAADLILLNGAQYASWTERYSLSPIKTVNTMKKHEAFFIYSGEEITHSHGPEGAHSHAALASLTWMDMKIAALQAESISKSLQRKQPEHRAEIQENFERLKADLYALDSGFKTLSERFHGKKGLGAHPDYSYFAKAYGLDIESFSWTGQQYPSPSQWTALEAKVQKEGIKFMVWNRSPHPDIAERLKKMGLEVLVLNTGATKPEKGDFIELMEHNLSALETLSTKI